MVNLKKIEVIKSYLQILIGELHADLINPEAKGSLDCARDDDGNVFISQYMLKKLLTRQVRYMSHQKKICGCEDCIRADVLHSSLNNW
jgi:hypothetical protein